jgi:hypothetical protein
MKKEMKIISWEHHWGDPDVDRIILIWIFRSGRGLWGLDGVGSG